MTDARDGGGHKPPGDEDRGEEPIRELADLSVEIAPGFLDRVRNRVDRRVTTAQFLSFTWYVPAALLLEFLDMVFSAFGNSGRSDGGSE